MIKRVEKDYDNYFGIEKVDDPFSSNRPVLLTMVPDKSYGDLNGYFSKLMYLLQIRSLEVDSNYTIGNLPFDMVSGESEENVSEKIISNIPVGDVNAAKQFLNNINIISYCAGNNETSELLKTIHEYLEQSNYKEDEIKDIMQEIFVLQIVDNNTEKGDITPIPYATTVIVQDVYDDINMNHVMDFNSDNPFISTMKIDGVRYMLYKSFGEGSLSEEIRDHVFRDDYVLAPVINTAISLYLIKALSYSLDNTSKKDISIYHELQPIIQKAEEFVKSSNKELEELSMSEKLELNKELFEEIKKEFPLNIPSKELTKEEKEYLTKKDEFIKLLKSKGITVAFDMYNKSLETIDQIIETYNNHSYGEIMYQRRTNSGSMVDITREEDIKLKIGYFKRNYDAFYQIISDIKYPDNASQEFREEFRKKLSEANLKISNKVNSDEYQRIISVVSSKESKAEDDHNKQL